MVLSLYQGLSVAAAFINGTKNGDFNGMCKRAFKNNPSMSILCE